MLVLPRSVLEAILRCANSLTQEIDKVPRRSIAQFFRAYLIAEANGFTVRFDKKPVINEAQFVKMLQKRPSEQVNTTVLQLPVGARHDANSEKVGKRKRVSMSIDKRSSSGEIVDMELSCVTCGTRLYVSVPQAEAAIASLERTGAAILICVCGQAQLIRRQLQKGNNCR